MFISEQDHVVTPDDGLTTLSRMAEYHGVSVADLERANPDIANRHPPESPQRGALESRDRVTVPQSRFTDQPIDSLTVQCPKDELEVELVFVLNCTDESIGSETVLAFTRDQIKEIEEEARLWEKLQRDLQAAAKTGNPQAIAQAKEAIAKPLSGVVKGPGKSKLVQIHRLGGRKTTWVRSDKLKNHWRSYRLDAVDGKRSFLTNDGKLDTKKLRSQFKEVSMKVKGDFPYFEGSTGGSALTLFSKNWADYVEGVNKNLSWSLNEGVPPETVSYDVSVDAQLLRYYAAGSVSWGFDPSKGRLGINGQGNATVALAEGRLLATGYWPSVAGHDMTIMVPTDNGGSQEVQLGHIRGKLELKCTGFVGASAQGAIALEVIPGKEKVSFKGADKQVDFRAKKSREPVTVSGNLFAGAEAGGTLTGAVDWDNPENRQDLNDPSSPNWKSFVEIGPGVTGSAGLGANAEFSIDFYEGNFTFCAKAGLVVGIGGSGEVSGSVDVNTVWEFMQFLYHKLKDENFHHLRFVAEAAFYAATVQQVWVIEKAGELTDAVGSGYNRVMQWWDKREATQEAAEELAVRILARPRMLDFTNPEAKGAMLYTLTETFLMSREEKQEKAIVKILSRLQTARDYVKVCERITLHGDKITPSNGETPAAIGERRIFAILDGSDLVKFGKKRREWVRKARDGIRSLPTDPRRFVAIRPSFSIR